MSTWRRRFQSFAEVFSAAWRNRQNLGYAWRILNNGVCDGCALGTYGMRDWTIDGIHLCWIRLNLLEYNTAPAFRVADLPDLAELRQLSEAQLRRLGRIPSPLMWEPADTKLHPLSWREAIDVIVEKLKLADPRKVAFYLVSRGTANETYYVAQKVARYLGTNNIDNSARVCHAPSTVGLKQSVGYAATTCSYRDFFDAEWIVFVGSNVANNQPVVMKYLHVAKKKGVKVAVVNPFLEPGLQRYWVPSSVDSAIFGTRIADEFFQIKPGGDIAFFNGVLKGLIESGGVKEEIIQRYTVGWEELRQFLTQLSWAEIERGAGLPKERIQDFVEIYARSERCIFVWSMGITMHEFGVQNVRAIANVALARGMVGKPGTGLMAIRGHSGVQGGAEMGAVPTHFPGGIPITPETAAQFSHQWGFPVPDWRGQFIVDTIDAAAEGNVEMLYAAGSNLFAVLPDAHYVRNALTQIPLRVHHDIVLNPQMFVEAKEAVLILPATTRYEMAGGNTETTTERRVIFNPEIPGPRIPEARDEWRVLLEIAQRVKPEVADKIHFESTQQIREEIARVIPLYDGIQHLRRKGDSFQWGGERLCKDYQFGTPDGKAHFAVVPLPENTAPEGKFWLSTRRGKQFNSIIFGNVDSLTSADRHTFLLNPQDMQKLGLREGEKIVLRSPAGSLTGHVRSAAVYPQTVVAFWPEANVLIPRGKTDPQCGIPAYRDTLVEILPAEKE